MRAKGGTAVRVTGSGASSPPWQRFRRDDSGASSVEYGLIVFAIAATIVLAVVALGPPVYGLFDHTCRAVDGQVGAGACP